MKIAILYQSDSGNTEMLAREIYHSLEEENTVIRDISDLGVIPVADFYFIGFGIHNLSCSMQIAEIFEQLGNVNYALFMTCGLYPTEKYIEKIRKNIGVWLPDGGYMVDAFMCQGAVDQGIRDWMIGKSPEAEEKLTEMFAEGANHPNAKDLNDVSTFAKYVIDKFKTGETEN